MSERQQAELTPEEERGNTQAVIAHVLPFAMWLIMMVLVDDPAWSYNARTAGGLLLLAIFRPWRYYPRIQWKSIPAGLGVGALIFIVWVGLEAPWVADNVPALMEWYDRLFVDLTKPFKTRELFDVGNGVMLPYEVINEGVHVGLHPYNPQVTGWLHFSIHMFGTSVVIAIIEEFFYRGFFYRWLQGSPFLKIDAGNLHWTMLLLSSLLFSLSHVEWGAAIICGLCYGLLYIKTRDIWAAIIAHGTTNFLLGVYVVKYSAYQFW